MDPVNPSSRRLWIPSLRFAGLLLVPLLLLPTMEVSGQLPSDRVDDFMESARGFSLLGTIHEGTLTQGQNLAIAVVLLEGFDYMVVGYCDRACTNLDLAISDPSGAEIQADRLPDAEPILTVTAESSGSHLIRADMGACSSAGCDIAVAVFGRTGEPGVAPGEDMAGRLTLVGFDLMNTGFSEVEDHKVGSLSADMAVRLPITLQESVEYRMVGVCDQDCFDLDLALFDPSGNEVASDFFEDAAPVLAHLPDTTGEYQVEVIMVSCEVEPCAFRVATFAREEDSGASGTTFSGEMLLYDTFHGKLEAGDEQLAGGYLDLYKVEARAGQRIVVDLRSDEFDTLLRLLDPDGEWEEVVESSGDSGHRHVEMLALKDGSYSVLVSSVLPESTGAYVLQIAVVG